MVNCAECGNRTLRPTRVKKEGIGWVLICQSCFGKRQENAGEPLIKQQGPGDCGPDEVWNDTIKQCVKKSKPTPKERRKREGHIRPEPIATKTNRQPEQIERCKDGEVYDKVLKKCLPLPKKPASELQGALPLGEKIRKQMRRMGYKPKKTREQVHLPAPQVPARPVTIVGPQTVEERLDSLELRFAEVEKNLANVLGLLGQRETWKTRRRR